MWQKCNGWWWLVAAVLWQSCQETELGKDLPYQGDRLVLYAELNPDEVVKLRLSKTYPPTGKFTVTLGLMGATVRLFENGVFKEQLTYSDSGNYVAASKLKPKVGFAYSFEVALTGFPSVSTLPVTIPGPVVNPNAVLRSDTIPSFLTGTARRLDIEWKDTASSINDYLVSVEGRYQNQFLGISTFQIGKDAEIEDGCTFTRNPNRYVLREICFPSQNFKTSLGVLTSGFLQDRNLPAGSARRNVDEYRLKIANISESYFRYLQDELQPTDFFLAFQLPKPRFTNVINGYGVVVAYNQHEFILSAK